MIAYLEGILEHKDNRSVIIKVAGVGYEVNVPASIFGKLPKIGEKVKLFTTLVVREDSQTLYGFLTREERNLFSILLSATGVGPKIALALLSGIEIDRLVVAITKGNVDLLTTIPGIGQKIAQRLIIELREKLSKEFGIVPSAVVAGLPVEQGILKDAISALMTLGYSPKEAREAIASANIDLASAKDLESIIKETLKVLSRT